MPICVDIGDLKTDKTIDSLIDAKVSVIGASNRTELTAIAIRKNLLKN